MAQLYDVLQTVTKALPAAAANNNSDPIDTLCIKGMGPPPPGLRFILSIPATPSLADSKSLTVTIQHSNDNQSYSTLAGVEQVVLTGGAGAGAPGRTVEFILPRGAGRYIRFNSAVGADGGNNTGVSVTLAAAI